MSLTNDQLAACKDVFLVHPLADHVLLCDDGSVFLPHAQNLADNHSRANAMNKPVRVERTEVMGEEAQTATDAGSDAVQAVQPLGCSAYPDEVGIRKGWKIPVHQLARHAQAMSGLSVEEWNALEEAGREEWMDEAVKALKATPRN